ncbi:MAG: LapA family protein [Proteobacteria bacterium]|nr:LapA family protein [Pseudomonadota bacterium]MBU1057749.1 LapA family protein [Pseudomonadota bacterium]
MYFKLILSLVLTGTVVLFVIQNISVVEISFLFWSFAMSRALLIFFVLAIAIVIGWLLHGYFSHRRNLPDKPLITS